MFSTHVLHRAGEFNSVGDCYYEGAKVRASCRYSAEFTFQQSGVKSDDEYRFSKEVTSPEYLELDYCKSVSRYFIGRDLTQERGT